MSIIEKPPITLAVTPTVSVDFTLSSDFSPIETISALKSMSDAVSQIAGKLLAHKQITTGTQYLPLLLQASQFLGQAAEMIQG